MIKELQVKAIMRQCVALRCVAWAKLRSKYIVDFQTTCSGSFQNMCVGVKSYAI